LDSEHEFPLQTRLRAKKQKTFSVAATPHVPDF
jgi:hypothetical protein